MQTLSYGCTSFDTETNALVLNGTNDYISSTERYDEPLFLGKKPCFSYAVLLNPVIIFLGLLYLSAFSL